MEAWTHRNTYMGIQQSLVELTEGQGDVYFNLSVVILTNSLRFQAFILPMCTYSPVPRFLFLSLGASV